MIMSSQLGTTEPAGLQCVHLHSLDLVLTKRRLQNVCGRQADEIDAIEDKVALLAEDED